MLTNPVTKGMTKALSAREGEQRQREAGKGQGWGGPVPVTHRAVQDHTGTAKPSSSRTMAVMVCWDRDSPPQTAAVPPREAPEPPFPKSSS